MDYNLQSLSPRAFEHLIQALALKYIGVGGVVFGDGPDGGREATFSGATDYDNGTGTWNGYVVLQAKFRQRPEDSGRDGKWLLDQVKREIGDYLDTDKGRRPPEYYLLATNVTLTAVPHQGSKDRLFKYVQETSGLRLKGFDVWDYDKLRALLDDSPELVRAYCAWITAGDVLHEAMAYFDRATPDFESTLTRYVQGELLSDQFANLEQAGHSPDERIPMASVFVDLPVQDSAAEEESRSPFLTETLIAASERLSPSCLGLDSHDPVLGRIVLVGGPGQGKTTLGQFLCQLFRAAILEYRPTHTVEPEVLAVLETLRDWCNVDGYEFPNVRRFPLRIPLSEFAVGLAQDPECTSVLAYIVNRIAKRTARNVDTELFREWLSAYPWILVLDGLDEVPPSSNRAEVLSAIKDFLIEVAESDADVLVVATTRPQGYSEEFDKRFYRHRYLSLLSADEAVRYGRRLSQVRFGENPGRVARVADRLAAAAESDATARLMTSPLQVTIMTILVDRQGHPPQERWSLFSAYYSAIYARELERDVPTAQVLRFHRADVDAIHRRVGLLLQAESERTSGTDARLSADRFESVVRERLIEEGYEGDELRDTQQLIVEAAANRLVFLVGLEQDVVGFEIRSLQEFMAAEGLMAGREEQVHRRLEGIAASPSWRNVFLFAAGKCFADRQHLRDAVHTIAANLNELDDPSLHAIFAGSRLAADILDEGTAGRQPKYARLFARLALRLLRSPPDSTQQQLAAIYQDALGGVFREELDEQLALEPFPLRLGAWNCLIALAARGIDWAVALCRSSWPADLNDAALLLALTDIEPSEDLREFLALETLRQPAWRSRRIVHHRIERETDGAPEWVQAVEQISFLRIRSGPGMRATLGEWATLTVDCGTFKDLERLRLGPLAALDAPHPTWMPLCALGLYSRTPSLSAASTVLRAAASVLEGVLPTATRTAWPVKGSARFLALIMPPIFTALVFTAESVAQVHERADALERGDYGTPDVWTRSEEHWRETSHALDEVVARFDSSQPLRFAGELLEFPVAAMRYVMVTEARQVPDDYIESVGELESPARSLAARLALRAAMRFSPRLDAPAITLRQWLRLTELADGETELFVSAPDTLGHLVREDSTAEDILAAAEALNGTAMAMFGRRRLSRRVVDVLLESVQQGGASSEVVKLLAVTVDPHQLEGTTIVTAEVPRTDDDDVLFAYQLMRLRPAVMAPTEATHDLTGALKREYFRLDLVLDYVSAAGADSAWRETFLVTLLETCDATDWMLEGRIVAAIAELVPQRLSLLADQAQWLGMGLPAPPP